MTDTIIGAFIGVGGAIIGAILAGPVTYFFSRKLIDKSHRNSLDIIKVSEFNSAAAKFRATFAPTQVKLSIRRELGNIGLRKFFDEEFALHATAIEEFRPFASDAYAYQKAYDEYKKALYDDDALGDANLRWNSNILISDDGDKHKDFIEHIKSKIEDVLYFAALY
jgi:hypothetical protein